jgi:hypothetical protein
MVSSFVTGFLTLANIDLPDFDLVGAASAPSSRWAESGDHPPEVVRIPQDAAAVPGTRHDID